MSSFHVRLASSAKDDAQFIVDAFDSTIPYLASIGAGEMWGAKPFSEKDGFKQETIKSIQKSEDPTDCTSMLIAEVDDAARGRGLAENNLPGENRTRTRVGHAEIRYETLPSYLTSQEELSQAITDVKDFIFLDVLIADFRTGTLHKGAGAALLDAIKDEGRRQGKKSLLLDCWMGNDGQLSRWGCSELAVSNSCLPERLFKSPQKRWTNDLEINVKKSKEKESYANVLLVWNFI